MKSFSSGFGDSEGFSVGCIVAGAAAFGLRLFRFNRIKTNTTTITTTATMIRYGAQSGKAAVCPPLPLGPAV